MLVLPQYLVSFPEKKTIGNYKLRLKTVGIALTQTLKAWPIFRWWFGEQPEIGKPICNNLNGRNTMYHYVSYPNLVRSRLPRAFLHVESGTSKSTRSGTPSIEKWYAHCKGFYRLGYVLWREYVQQDFRFIHFGKIPGVKATAWDSTIDQCQL